MGELTDILGEFKIVPPVQVTDKPETEKEAIIRHIRQQKNLIKWLDGRIQKWRKLYWIWSGKFHEVRRENNKLRRAMYNQKKKMTTS
jgi:hypothetical protein